MKIYKTILSILDEKGPLSIPLICQEVNRLLETNHHKPVLPSYIKSIITRNSDLFCNKNGSIFIAPDKNPYFLVVILNDDDGLTHQVNINFSKNTFSFFEWREKGYIRDQSRGLYPICLGNLETFKREVMAMNIWEWKPFYGTCTGITIGKTNWSVKLKTKSKTYVCEGTDSFPEKWPDFCKAVDKLSGGLFTMVKFFQ